jgi:hypothetical protein
MNTRERVELDEWLAYLMKYVGRLTHVGSWSVGWEIVPLEVQENRPVVKVRIERIEIVSVPMFRHRSRFKASKNGYVYFVGRIVGENRFRSGRELRFCVDTGSSLRVIDEGSG